MRREAKLRWGAALPALTEFAVGVLPLLADHVPLRGRGQAGRMLIVVNSLQAGLLTEEQWEIITSGGREGCDVVLRLGL